MRPRTSPQPLACTLGVTQASALHLGNVAGIIARGAEHLGMSHKSLMRNAPDCDGQGICCFGCPTGAKRSTDVSYVPAALARGAQLVTAARVDFVDIVAGRARGVTATLGGSQTASDAIQSIAAFASRNGGQCPMLSGRNWRYRSSPAADSTHSAPADPRSR